MVFHEQMDKKAMRQRVMAMAAAVAMLMGCCDVVWAQASPQGDGDGGAEPEAAEPEAAEPEAAEPADRSAIEHTAADSADLPWASDTPLATRNRAHGLFLAGNELMRQGLFRQGAEKYRAALALWDHPAFHFNLSVAQMNLDQIIAAHEGFGKARAHGPRPIGQDKYEQAQYYLNVLGNQLAEVDVVCNEPGAAVAMDGRPLFRGPGTERVRVRPGRHRIEANKPGMEADIREIVLSPGDKVEAVLAPRYPERLTTTRRWPQWLPWAVMGVGGSVMAAGAYFDRASSSSFNQFDDEFDTLCKPEGCLGDEVPADLKAQLDSGNRDQWIARVIYGVGGAIVISSAVMLYLNRERLVTERAPSEGAAVSLLPSMTDKHAAMQVRITF